MDEPTPVFAVVELMGHIRLAGRLTEEEKFGQKMGRIDVPLPTGTVTQYFGAGSVFRITLVTEEVATAVARNLIQPVPVSSFDMKPDVMQPAAIERRHYKDDDSIDDMENQFGS